MKHNQEPFEHYHGTETQPDFLSTVSIIAGLVALLATLMYFGVVVDAIIELIEMV